MNNLREINIKNRGCYCPNNMIYIKDLDLDKILVYEKQYQNISIYNVAYKNHPLQKTFAY